MFSSLQKVMKFLLFGIILFLECSAVIIKTKQGSLDGVVLESRNGTKYHAFMGIPYVKPPVGSLRFEAPQPPDSWSGVRDATKPGSKCIQSTELIKFGNDTDIGQEDCLYLNVYVPSKPKSHSKLPVMVWIHGGGFVIGEGLHYDPKYLLDYDIVIVTFNYRVGALGFLSAGDEILPGNYGLKDQVAALKWVQEYIADFGGDPQQVTIAGVSAGGASVHLLMHSPLSTGLFQRAISQSGSALASWVQIPPAAAYQRSQSFGILAGCPTESTQVLVNCLKKISAKEILQIQQKFYVWDISPLNVFPLVKEPANVKDAFLREDPWNQKVVQDVPWIVGFTSAEGNMFSYRFLSNEEKLAKEMNKDYERLLPMSLYYLYWLKNDDVVRITEQLKQFYLGDKKFSFEVAENMTNLLSDAFFIYDSMEAAYRHTNKVFVYYFDHKGEHSLSQLYCNCSFELGVGHGEDMLCFFPIPVLPSFTLSLRDFQVSERMIKYWINYAYTGNPTPNNVWVPSESKEELTYLHIKTERDYVKTGLLQDRYLFWKNLGIHPSNMVVEKPVLSDEL